MPHRCPEWVLVEPSRAWAELLFDRWCSWARRSRLEPMKKVAGMLERHGALLMNWFLAKGTMSSGVVEGAVELGSDATLWLEANAREQNGVSFTKGCYVGQENTARMNYRQKVNRRLAVVPADAEPEGARAWYADLGLAVVRERIS